MKSVGKFGGNRKIRKMWLVGDLADGVDVVDSPSTTSTPSVDKPTSNKHARFNAKRKQQKVEDQRARRLKQKESKPIKKRETRSAINKRHNAKRRQPAAQDFADEVSELRCSKC